MGLSLQRIRGRARPSARRAAATRTAFRQIALSLSADFCRRAASLRWPKFYSGPPGFGKANRNGLLRGTRAVFTLAYVVHFFADELTCLRRRRLSFAFVAFGALQRFFFWHVAPSASFSSGGSCGDRIRVLCTAESGSCCKAGFCAAVCVPGGRIRIQASPRWSSWY